MLVLSRTSLRFLLMVIEKVMTRLSVFPLELCTEKVVAHDGCGLLAVMSE